MAPRSLRVSIWAFACVAIMAAMLLPVVPSRAARPRDLALRRVLLELSGPPAVIVGADLNGDGRRDLLVVSSYTRWGSISSDRVEEAIEVTEVVPALFDLREARAFLAQPFGDYRPVGSPLALPSSVLSAEAGPTAHPVVVLTDGGLSEIRLSGPRGAETLALEPLLDEPCAFAGTGAMLPDFSVLVDVDGDRRKDFVTVTLEFSKLQALRALISKKVSVGLEFHVVAQRVDGSFRLVPDQSLDETLHLDLNRVQISRLAHFQGDFDGDGRVDFVHLGRGKSVTIHRGQPGGRYGEKPDLTITLDEEPEDVMLVRVRDFDGDGRSDLAITRTLPPREAGASAPAHLELELSGDGR